MLGSDVRENILGTAEVRDVFRSPKFGAIAGCMVIEGVVHRNRPIRVLREDIVIFEGELESLRRFKDDASEVRAGMECVSASRATTTSKLATRSKFTRRFRLLAASNSRTSRATASRRMQVRGTASGL
jgi:translation initiation factor IF-2